MEGAVRVPAPWCGSSLCHRCRIIADPRHAAPGGLAFFNCGDASGHSQPHKHVQLVPLPLGPSATGHSLPIQPLVEAARPATGSVFSVRELPFRNYCIAMERRGGVEAHPTPEELARYHDQLRTLALADCPAEQPSYNLLLTRTWMMALPRRQEAGMGLPLNALAFAGTLLVRSAADLDRARAHPMAALAEAGFPW